MEPRCCAWRGVYCNSVPLWVPKRPMTGIGQAINLAHPGAKTFIAGILIMPTVVALVVVGLLLFGK